MISEKELEKLHKCEVKPLDNAASRFSHKVECSCGVQGLFYSEEEALQFKELHLYRKRRFPY